MAECECLPGCPFYNDRMADSKGLSAIYKRRYCLGDNTKCARYMVFKALGKPMVPPDLYPNMAERAKSIIEAK